jgi:hypothetical protein
MATRAVVQTTPSTPRAQAFTIARDGLPDRSARMERFNASRSKFGTASSDPCRLAISRAEITIRLRLLCGKCKGHHAKKDLARNILGKTLFANCVIGDADKPDIAEER